MPTTGQADVLTMSTIDEHRRHLEYLNRRPGTIRQRVLTLQRLAADRPILELVEADLRTFVEQKKENGEPKLGIEARAAAVSHIRGFYKWAVYEGLLESDPSARMQRPRRERRIPRPMEDKDAAAALQAAENPIREWLYLAAYAGLRACEIAQLRGRDFLLAQQPPMLIIRESKGGDPSVVPLAAELRPVIASVAAADGWCFPKGRGGAGHVTAGQVQRRANAFLHELGISDTLHTLRHWYGTQAYRATGRDLRATQELMRHRSPVSTAGYTKVDPGESARALDLLPSLTA